MVAGRLLRASLHPQTVAGLLTFGALVGVIMLTSRIEPEFGIFTALGTGFGMTLQRSRFCFNSAFRDLIQFRSGRTMKGVIVGMAVATVGFGLQMYTLLPNPRLGTVAPEAHAVPVGPALVVGGLLFGIGMVVAGGCTSGSLYRMGEGYVASWVSFGGILVGLLIAAYTWNWWWVHTIRIAPVVWFPQYLGYGGAVALTLVGLLAAYLLVLWIESTGGVGVQEYAPPPPAARFGEKVKSLTDGLLARGWPAAIGGAAMGGLNILSYQTHMPWRVVGELSRWAAAGATALGLDPPAPQGTENLSACTLQVGGGLLTHGFLLNVGLVAGSFAAALLAREFKLRVPRNRVRYVQSLAGGALMGYGSGLALGCTAGAFFSAVPSLALNGWVFAAALVGGAFVGTKIIDRIP